MPDTDMLATEPVTASRVDRSSVLVKACRRLELAEAPVALKELALEAGMSPWQLHRLFVAEVGLTPHAYGAAVRAQRLRERLAGSGESVTEAIYASGFNASSRFYEASGRILGMRARDYRAGAPGVRITFAVGQCSLGAILVAESTQGICAILLDDDPDALVRDIQDRFPRAELVAGDSDFERRVAQVVGFIEAPHQGLHLPLDIRGTAFQERVWRALLAVPAGTTISYTELANRIGSPSAVRAVARACGANPIAVAIPCHRVVRSNGDLSGYRWGLERKRELLERERQNAGR